ncbi:MAG TPA: hypothetical protein VF033_00290 [Steroidobacteraceae bacterium]
MKTLLKLAVGAAIAGALVNLLRKQRSRSDEFPQSDQTQSAGAGREPPGSRGFTLEEIAGENAEWGGGSSGLNA